MIDLKRFEAWFITGSQHLYGEETLKQVAEHSQQIAKALDTNTNLPVRIVFKPVVKTPEEIFEGGVQFFMHATGVDRELGERLTRRNMNGLPYWQKHPFALLEGSKASDEEYEKMIAKL